MPKPLDSSQIAELLNACRNRDRRALARLITWLDDGGDASLLDLSREDRPRTFRRIALTGAGGVGKSSLVAAMVKLLRSRDIKVAALLCDPSSYRSGGALLGDRVRIDEPADDPWLFVRSMATRGDLGGISQTAGPIADLLGLFGFEVVLIETIGVGQDQVAAREMADVLVMITTPLGGDEVQWQKAGVLECADLVVVNKADLGGADKLVRSLKDVTGLPVLTTSAGTGQGIEELGHAILEMPAANGCGPTRT